MLDSLAGSDGISATDGVDARGRAARVLTTTHADDPTPTETLSYYIDPATGQELEQVNSHGGLTDNTIVVTDVAYTPDHTS